MPLKVLLFRKAKPTGVVKHVLDVNLYFTGAAGVDATAAKTNALESGDQRGLPAALSAIPRTSPRGVISDSPPARA